MEMLYCSRTHRHMDRTDFVTLTDGAGAMMPGTPGLSPKRGFSDKKYVCYCCDLVKDEFPPKQFLISSLGPDVIMLHGGNFIPTEN